MNLSSKNREPVLDVVTLDRPFFGGVIWPDK
jgi:hypothetical protein